MSYFRYFMLTIITIFSLVPLVPVQASPPAQNGASTPSYFLIGSYTAKVSGQTAGGSFAATFEPNAPDNFLFDDYPIVGFVFHVTNFAGYAGNNQSRFGIGVPAHADDYDNPALDEHLIIGNNEIRYSWDRYVCTGSILNDTYSSNSTFTTAPVCGGVEPLFPNTDFRDEFSVSGFQVVDAGYPLSVVPYADCRSYSGVHDCSATIEYWLIGWGIPPDGGGSGGGGGGELPPCPPETFSEDDLSISWMAACYHCLVGNDPDPTLQPTDIPAGTPEPTALPTATAFAPTAQPTVPVPTVTPAVSPTPEPVTPENWFYIDGSIVTSSGDIVDITSSADIPVYAVIVEFLIYPTFKPLHVLVDVQGTSPWVLEYYNEYRYFYGDYSLYAGALIDSTPKIRMSKEYARLDALQPLFNLSTVPISIEFALCDEIPQAVCSMHYRLWVLSTAVPDTPQVPPASPWSEFGTTVGGGGGGLDGGGLVDCTVPEYVGDDGGGVDDGVGGDIIDWEIDLRDGDCIAIIPGIDEEVAGQSIVMPSVSICPSYLDLPEVVILDLTIPLTAIFLLPVGMFLVNFLRTL